MSEPAATLPELFHAIADPASAEVRRVIGARGLAGRLRMRNVFYPEASADLAARGGRGVPALWDGERLVEGVDAVLAALAALG